MFDIDEIMKRAQQAGERASRQLNESMEKAEKIAEQAWAGAGKAAGAAPQQQAAGEDPSANQRRQVEILGQFYSPETMAQMADDETRIGRLVDERVKEAAALGVEGMMGELFGEDMGVIAAALETLAEEESGEEDLPELGPEREEELYGILEQKMEQIGSLPESEPSPYQKGDPRWGRFGVLLSGIISHLNDHRLDGMEVEEHIPVLEQRIVSLVRRSWGINGRGELLDTIRRLTREGYVLRYQAFCEAASPEELTDEEDEWEERESIRRGWRFAQRYKDRFAPGFLTGWDVGRAAMLARWGCYLGWITEGEAVGLLNDLSQRAAEELESWREFACSYLFGGLLWKLICGDDGESYLGFLADAATDLLTGPEGAEWQACPWPAARRIGFEI